VLTGAYRATKLPTVNAMTAVSPSSLTVMSPNNRDGALFVESLRIGHGHCECRAT